MTFFEQELRKIVGSEYPDATYVGRACYVRLSDMDRAKLQFTTSGIAGNYDTLQMTILNRNEGVVDKLALKLRDVLGEKKVDNPNFRGGVSPHIYESYNKLELDWYVYYPNDSDYQQLTDAVTDYLEVFQEQTDDQQWQQTM